METTHPVGAQAVPRRRRDAGSRLARVIGAIVCAAWFSLWATTGVRAEPLELPLGGLEFRGQRQFHRPFGPAASLPDRPSVGGSEGG